MSWIQKLLPPKIKRVEGVKKSIPEGLWCKCPSCEAVLYSTDLESNQGVCPKCSHHHRMKARARLDALLDEDGRYEIGSEVLPTDILKFKDSKRYPDRLLAAHEDTGEADALDFEGFTVVQHAHAGIGEMLLDDFGLSAFMVMVAEHAHDRDRQIR